MVKANDGFLLCSNSFQVSQHFDHFIRVFSSGQSGTVTADIVSTVVTGLYLLNDVCFYLAQNS